MPLRLIGPAGAIVLALAFGVTQIAPAGAIESSPGAASDTEAAAPSVDLAVIVPITAPITDADVVYDDGTAPTRPPSLIDAATLALYTAPDGVLTQRLDAVYDRGVTIAIDPLVIASIRALGAEAPASARDWLSRLDSATNPSFELSWADSDLTAPLQAGRRSPVQYTSLDFAIDPSRFTTDVPTPDPASTPDDSQAPPLPTSSELTAWDYTISNVAWPQPDTVTAHDDKIIRSAYDLTLLADGNVVGRSPARAGTTIGGKPVVVTDSSISKQLTVAASADAADQQWVAKSAAAQAAIAAFATSNAGATTPSLAVVVGRDATLPVDHLGATLDALVSTPGVSLVGLGSLATSDAPASKIHSERQSATRISTIKSMLSKESQVTAFSSIAEKPALITGERRIRLLNALSPSGSTYPGGWDALASQYLDEVQKTLASVSIEKGSNLLFLADRGTISVEVSNQLDQPVTVYVLMRALSPILAVDDPRVKITVEPHSVNRAAIPVESVSNGTVELSASLVGSTGVSIGEPVLRKTSVRAGWEGPVTLIGGILLVLIFAGGIVRSVVRRRRASTPEADD